MAPGPSFLTHGSMLEMEIERRGALPAPPPISIEALVTPFTVQVTV